MNRRTSKACDGCHVRKVRCNGNLPCQQCSHLGLPCRFSPARRARNPGVRGRLVAQLRNGEVKTSSTRPHRSLRPGCEDDRTSPTALAVETPKPPLECSYPAEFFIGLVPDYEKYAYPVNPVITADEVLESIACMETDASHAAFAYAFAAVTINLTDTWAHAGETATRILHLMSQSLAIRRTIDPIDALTESAITVRRIVTCVFLEICMMTFKRYDHSFLLLREAISMIQMLRVERRDPKNPEGMPASELARRQRLYWEAFVHERFLTIMSNMPSILPPLPTGLPMEDPTIPPNVQIGFSRLIRLFIVMDGEFLALWIAQDDPHQEFPEISSAWIENRQQLLDEDEAAAAAEMDDQPGLTDLQHADLFVTRLWLRTLLWQLAMSRCLLSSSPPTHAHEAMSLVFPVCRLSAQLRELVARLEIKTTIGMHGSGILRKLFEITNTVADVMALVPAAAGGEVEGYQRMEDFLFLVRVLFSFERTEAIQRDIIETKVEALRRMFPDAIPWDLRLGLHMEKV